MILRLHTKNTIFFPNIAAQKVILLYPGNGTHAPIEAPFEPVPGHSSFVLSCSMDYANLVAESGRLTVFAHQFKSALRSAHVCL